MLRRSLLGTGAAAAILPRTSIAQPANARTLIFVPQANLTSLDPIWTTAPVTRNYAYLVFDTLFGTDDKLVPQPQMAEGAVSAEDGRRWTIRLRDGLLFHDNTPVLARDCVASLQRWMKRDILASSIAPLVDALEAPDDRTIVFRLKRPFPLLINALAKSQPSPAMIMPERIAATDPFKQITEVVGSGPFRFLPDEYVAGSRAIFARHAGYKPRDDAPSSLAGGKRALVDRVEWRIIPEAGTAANALRSGEIDWLEMPIPDLIPVLKSSKDVVVGRLDPYGLYPVLRFNSTQGPTANQKLRQAILAAINPREVMQAVMGDDASTYHAPIGCFLPGTPSGNDVAMDRVGGTKPVAELRAMVKDAGYNGEKLVLLHPTDQPFYDAMSQVCAATMKSIGLAVDDASMDWGTVVQRRTNREPLEKGGWSMFCSAFPALDYTDPLTAPGLRGTGDKAYYGWPTDAPIEDLRQQWIDAADPAARQRLAGEIQARAFTTAAQVPLGQYFQSAAWRSNITGHLKAQPPLFWNVTKG
jgi:peptide/nickel transport system substrate-binding protein